MDFICPGFWYPPSPKTENQPIAGHGRNTKITRSQRIWMSLLNCASGTFKDANKEREQTHWENMEVLKERTTVHSSRSLDHYCHQRAPWNELQERVEDQVLTRFMERQAYGEDKSMTREESTDQNTLLAMCLNVVHNLCSSISRSRSPLQLEATIEEGHGRGKSTVETIRNTEKLVNSATDTHDAQSPLEILVVPQIWLWKFDSECEASKTKHNHKRTFPDLRFPPDLVITSFPERWDCTSQRETLLDTIRRRVEYLNVDVHPNVLVTEILTACAEFQPTLTVGKQSFTWLEAFDDEILSVVSQLGPYPSTKKLEWSTQQHHFAEWLTIRPKSRKNQSLALHFERNSRVSDAGFPAIFRAAMDCLRSIEDVLDELTSIKRVFQDQLQVWEKVHTSSMPCMVCNGHRSNHDDDREERSNACASNPLPKQSLELVSSLEEQAVKVRESASILSCAKPGPNAFGADSLG